MVFVNTKFSTVLQWNTDVLTGEELKSVEEQLEKKFEQHRRANTDTAISPNIVGRIIGRT